MAKFNNKPGNQQARAQSRRSEEECRIIAPGQFETFRAPAGPDLKEKKKTQATFIVFQPKLTLES